MALGKVATVKTGIAVSQLFISISVSICCAKDKSQSGASAGTTIMDNLTEYRNDLAG